MEPGRCTVMQFILRLRATTRCPFLLPFINGSSGQTSSHRGLLFRERLEVHPESGRRTRGSTKPAMESFAPSLAHLSNEVRSVSMPLIDVIYAQASLNADAQQKLTKNLWATALRWEGIELSEAAASV